MVAIRRKAAASSLLPLASNVASSATFRSKCSSMARLSRLITMMISVKPACTASSTTSWMTGVSTTGIISLGIPLLIGKKRVP